MSDEGLSDEGLSLKERMISKCIIITLKAVMSRK
jgi:hypothetical protein